MSNVLTLSDTTTDFSDFVSQFNAVLATNPVWKGTLTTQTSTTLIELVSSIGVLDSAKILRYYEDSFSDTVQSDGAIRAIAVMQGIRLTRKLPAVVSVSLTSVADVVLGPYTQFNCGGYPFFNREQINLTAGVEATVDLYEGTVKTVTLRGLGSALQVYLSQEDAFVVSDQDVEVLINQTIIEKAYGGLWNYKGKDAFSDLTHPDGRLMIQFGNSQYGTVPQVNDTVAVIYVTTKGDDGNALAIKNSNVVLSNSDLIKGLVLTSPTGGADEKDTQAYKNVEAGAFGAYASSVTRDQYHALVKTYPGIVDAITQAQREINPMKKEWMNTIRVAALTSSPWTAAQKRAFCKYCQDHTMFSPYFIWVDPIPVTRDITVEVHCLNTAVPSLVKTNAEQAIRKLFAPRPGILLTNFYPDDIAAVVREANPGSVSYVKVVAPTYDMLVTAPPPPEMDAVVVPGGGALTELLYAYGISIVNAAGEEGSPNKWVFPQIVKGVSGAIKLTWPESSNAVTYHIWGRKAGSIGLLATLPAGTTSWVDDGSVTPSGTAPNSIAELPIRYNQLGTLSVHADYADRQQRFGS